MEAELGSTSLSLTKSANVSGPPARERVSRETMIGIGASALAVFAMAVDHLLEDGGGFAADPAAFGIGVGLSLALAAVVFGRVVSRARAVGPESAAKRAIVCSLLAAVGLVTLLWLGLPIVLGAGGMALGLIGRRGERRRLALAAIAVGVIVVGSAPRRTSGRQSTSSRSPAIPNRSEAQDATARSCPARLPVGPAAASGPGILPG